ncbi:MAG: DUF58 domain-containing protein [Chloroflexi bacterium]|nr:DUF58 domain-containing protein [Chloroflexota bacterium]
MMRIVPRKRLYLIVILLAVTTVTALATGLGIFYRLLYIMALAAGLSFIWSWLSLKALNVVVDRRRLQVQVGDPLNENITVENLSKLPRPGIVVEDTSDLPGFSTGRVVHLGPSSRQSWIATGTARKRGLYTLGPIRLSCIDPFGLFNTEQIRHGSVSVVVYPKTYEVPEFSMPAALLSGESSLKKRTHDLTPYASSIREYAAGDSLSRVHWNSTARLGKLMSKDFDEGRSSDVWVVVDLHRDVQAGTLEDSTDEYAVSIGASLAKRFLATGLPVGMLVYGDKKYVVPAETGSGQLDQMMEYLARAKATGNVTLGEALPKDEALWTNHTTLIVITASPRQEWVTALQELMRRRVRIASVLLDGRSFGGFFDSREALKYLDNAGVPTYLVRNGENVSVALSRVHNATETNSSIRPELVGTVAS